MEERVILVQILSLDCFDWDNHRISSDLFQKKKKKKKKTKEKNVAELGNGFLIFEDYDRLLSSIFAVK